jgi:hypothetical protein
MLESLMHFIKHFLGLCGESHPSVLVSGFGFFTIVTIYISDIIHYIKDKVNG